MSEAGNLSSLAYMAFGKKWDTEDKEMFNNPYSQFVKIETDFTKYWRVSSTSHLVGHINAGVIYAYGNSSKAPFSALLSETISTCCLSCPGLMRLMSGPCYRTHQVGIGESPTPPPVPLWGVPPKKKRYKKH